MRNEIYLFILLINLIFCQQNQMTSLDNDTIKTKIHYTLIIFLSSVIGLVTIVVILMFIYQPTIRNSQNIFISNNTFSNDGEELQDLNIDSNSLTENK